MQKETVFSDDNLCHEMTRIKDLSRGAQHNAGHVAMVQGVIVKQAMDENEAADKTNRSFSLSLAPVETPKRQATHPDNISVPVATAATVHTTNNAVTSAVSQKPQHQLPALGLGCVCPLVRFGTSGVASVALSLSMNTGSVLSEEQHTKHQQQQHQQQQQQQ